MTALRSSLGRRTPRSPTSEAEMRDLQDQVNSRGVGVFIFWADLRDDFERQFLKNIINRLKGSKQ